MANNLKPSSKPSSGNASKSASRSGTASPKANVHPATEIAQGFDPVPADGEDLEADLEDGDSAYASSINSETTTMHSSIARGIIEFGRRYQATRETNINIPSDDKQFDSMEAGHMAHTALESQQDNPFFRSPISPDAQYILDLGTGMGSWAINVADLFPNVQVHGVDLYPPPVSWVPPNCVLEVDDITKPFTYHHKWDLVHIRGLNGSLQTEEWAKLYKRIYNNLNPGGWIEHYDAVIPIRCDDGSLPADSLLADFGREMKACTDKTGNTIAVCDLMRAGIEEAGFINVHEKDYKLPIGSWPRHPLYKEAGEHRLREFKEGLQGWIYWALTKFGAPEPWSEDEVIVYVAKVRQELDRRYHIYQNQKRVWAQKPYDAKESDVQPVLEDA